ncbi:unnamed protein product [Phaeothamnion confervicola]
MSALAALKEDGQLSLYNSSNPFYLAEMKVATGLRGDIVDQLGLNGRRDVDRIAAILGGLVVGSFLGSSAVIQALPGPDIIRWTVSWSIAFLPYGFLSLGLAKPGLLQAAVVWLQRLDGDFRERLLRHEAGHFLMGHLCGLPVQEYQADAVTNAVQFYPLSDSSAGGSLWRRRGLSHDDVTRLAIVSLGGIVAECAAYGNSEGGYADLSQLQEFVRMAEPPLTDREQQERVRFAAVMAHTYLKTHDAPFEALLAAFRRKASVAECMKALEDVAAAGRAAS